MSIILGSFGDWQGTPIAPRCPDRTVLIGVGATASAKWIVSLDTLFCQNLNDVIAKQMDNVVSVSIPQNVRVHFDEGGAYPVKHILEPGLAVTGANIRAGHRVEGLELFGRDVAMLHSAVVAKPYIGAARGELTSVEVPPSARAFAVGLNAEQLDDGTSSCVTRFDLVCDQRTDEMYTAMESPGAASMRPELRKCIGLDSYGFMEAKYAPDVCTQFAARYCPSMPARLLECNNSHFCKLNPEFCDSAYKVLCETIDSTNQKFCACSFNNPQMLNFQGYNPACHNNDCYNKSTAYQTRGQAMQHCNTMVICLQELIRTSVKQADLINVTYTNSCGLNASNIAPTDLQKQMMIDPDKGTADALAVHVGSSVRGGSSAPATKNAPPVFLPSVPLPVPPPEAAAPEVAAPEAAAPEAAAPTSVPISAAPALPSPALPGSGRNEGADIDMAIMMSEDDVLSDKMPPATVTLAPSSAAQHKSSIVAQQEPKINYFVWVVIIIILAMGTGAMISRMTKKGKK